MPFSVVVTQNDGSNLPRERETGDSAFLPVNRARDRSSGSYSLSRRPPENLSAQSVESTRSRRILAQTRIPEPRPGPGRESP